MMETTKLKKFAQFARRSLLEQVSGKFEQVLADGSPARRENSKAVKQLEEAITNHSKQHIIEQVAYTWFNRFCALRFMDVNRYNRVNIVSPADPGQFQPEILAEAKMGHIDEAMVSEQRRQQVFDLLEGKAPSADPQGEAYRLLLVAACNAWNEAMPFLFQRIDDYTELLMPDDLLSGKSILAYTREAMTPNVCQDVEVIGWLYQFYISEKKDEVFAGLKNKKKITPENIPAATQLFTPHWIVRYLVENSLGRLWMLNRPNSKLALQMDYYIKPEQAETDFLRLSTPEDIKICDPACGSGHMLTYAFDVLYAIYEEEGYEPTEIAQKILTHNLYGIEIDERAGELAAFALTMKARAKQRRFFSKGVKPNICVLQNVHFEESELKDYMDAVGRDLFTESLQNTLRQFEEAKNFGSLIRPEVTDVDGMLSILASKDVSEQLFLSMTHQKVLRVLRQVDYLSPKYHVVIANPPYMGSRGMNGGLLTWAKDNYPDSKSDLFSMFIERNLGLIQKHGVVAMLTMQSWMFLPSFETLRAHLLNQKTLLSMAHLGTRAFDSISGEVVSTTAFVLKNSRGLDYKGVYLSLVDGNSEVEKDNTLREAVRQPNRGRLHLSSSADFNKMPSTPVAYWVSDALMKIFQKGIYFKDNFISKQGLATGNNDKFVRFWYEVFEEKTDFSQKKYSSFKSSKKWFPYSKGGSARKWYGNHELIVNWENNGENLKEYKNPSGKRLSTLKNLTYMFAEAITWSLTASSGGLRVRWRQHGFVFDTNGLSAFPKKDINTVFGVTLLNSKVAQEVLRILNPTMAFQTGDIDRVPIPENFEVLEKRHSGQVCIQLAKADWDSFETSWDFTSLPLLSSDYCQPTLEGTYQKLRAHWQEMTLEMQRLEEENNRIFIDAYGLQDELTPDVPLSEITLTCNPHYRYNSDKSEEELEALLLADTMRELVSYAVGCMFGRYALDEPGLILANQGETIDDYLKRVPEPSFPADDDNVIPMLDGDWFTDDIVERFRKFLRVAFAEEHYQENLQFVEQALNIKGKRNYSIRDYFLSEFYDDHVKRYKKRPIYWLFSSPKGSFNALIYMHRYRPDTVSVVLNDYLREFRTKLSAHKNHLEAVSISASSSQADKTKALKELDQISKVIAELETYERDVLYPLATKQLDIDLDDGVKVNYPKLGKALQKVSGLS